MADETPSKSDIHAVFKRLRSVGTNKVCFDCGAKNPTWSSVTYGVFICLECSATHRGLGVHLTFVRSTQLDTNWTWLQLRQMQLGGNANATTFFRQHNCTSLDAQLKYTSRAAQLYRDKLYHLAAQAMRLYGTQLHVSSSQQAPNSPEEKEVDFFEEHTNNNSVAESHTNANVLPEVSEPKLVSNGSVPTAEGEDNGPNVDAALSGTSPTKAQAQLAGRKCTIGQRKAQKKSGIGAKKGGLGAQRVKTNFTKIEKEAQLADQIKEQTTEDTKTADIRSKEEEEEKQLLSMRLTYQDLSLQQKQQEEKLRQVDPKKAQQMERLGMGFGSRGGVSHSVVSDMKVIEQTKPANSSRSLFDQDGDIDINCFDEFECWSFSSSRFSSKNGAFDDKFDGPLSTKDDLFGPKKSPWDNEFDKYNKKPPIIEEMFKEPEETPKRSTMGFSSSTNDEAQKKFGNAKAISSSQFFEGASDADFERRANLSRFEGSSSISSADFFGEGQTNKSSGALANIHAPDFDDVKESMRQGMTKVAGRITNLASGVMSSIQRK